MMKIEAFHDRKESKIEFEIDEQGNLVDEEDLIKHDSDQLDERLKKSTSKLRKVGLKMNEKLCIALLYLLEKNHTYRTLFCRHWKPKNVTRDKYKLQIQMSPDADNIDLSGNRLASILLWEFIELEDAMHWLSTLGGAFSNLGEHDLKFAKRAGDNAYKQLTLANKFGDRTVIAKCLLFVSMSLMQQANFFKSAVIVRHVFAHCRAPGMKDLAGTGKLLAMCRGIWARLKYEAGKSVGEDSENGNILPMENNGKDDAPKEIEIEFKFKVPENFIEQLTGLGASRIGEKSMADVYLDTTNFDLIRKDHWLRIRNGSIELKFPASAHHHVGDNTVYQEITSAVEIEQVLGQPIPEGEDRLPAGWTFLARVDTRREMWKLNDFNIVVDTLPDGFKIGEIEFVSNSSVEAGDASERLNDLSRKLGLNKQIQGKLDHCLRVNNPEAFKVLSETFAKVY